MSEQQPPVAPNKKTVRIMILLIILLLICIATRWGYIKQEIVDTTRGMFSKEVPAKAADSLRK